MPTRKIKDFSRKAICRHPDHNPPMHVVLEPGIYEHTCSGCGATQVFVVPLGPIWQSIKAELQKPLRHEWEKDYRLSASVEAGSVPMGYY